MLPGYRWRADRRSSRGERSKYFFLVGLAFNLVILPIAWFDGNGATVVVEANVPDAVYVLGRETPRRSPGAALFAHVPFGRHDVRVERQHYQPFHTTIEVGWFSRPAIRAALVPLPVELLVQTTPGAEVLIDGKPVGRAGVDGTFRVADGGLGRHEVSVRLKGYQDWARTQEFYPPGVSVYVPLTMTAEKRQALEEERQRIYLLLANARQRFSAGQYTDAMTALDQILLLQPDHIEARQLRDQVRQTMEILNVR